MRLGAHSAPFSFALEPGQIVGITGLEGQGQDDFVRILAGIKEQIRAVTSGSPGKLVWPGLLRRLDRRNPGYAD